MTLWHKHGERRSPRALPPLDRAALDRLALRYVERFATTRGKLVRYLDRKLKERGWAEDAPAEPAALAERLADLGYVDDRGFAEAKASAMARRGLGARRVTGALRAAGIDAADAEALSPAIEDRAEEAALAFARRKRIGPFADQPADRDTQQKQLAAMVRAGHDFATARRVLTLSRDALDEAGEGGFPPAKPLC